MASLIFTSFTDVPSLVLVYVDPKYLNWSNSSSVFPLIHILADGLGLMLLTIILLLSELIFMPYSAAVSPVFKSVAGVLLHCLHEVSKPSAFSFTGIY